jgi:hypothetical protein
VTFADVVARLEDGLGRELPGPEAQDRLAPVPRREWPAGFNIARIRHAAGLLLVFPKPATTINAETQNPQPPVQLVSACSASSAFCRLTKRTSSSLYAPTLRHGGQVSLPGGVVEPGRRSSRQREAHEGVALPLGRSA